MRSEPCEMNGRFDSQAVPGKYNACRECHKQVRVNARGVVNDHLVFKPSPTRLKAISTFRSMRGLP